jgi:hypothetical protein
MITGSRYRKLDLGAFLEFPSSLQRLLPGGNNGTTVPFHKLDIPTFHHSPTSPAYSAVVRLRRPDSSFKAMTAE